MSTISVCFVLSSDDSDEDLSKFEHNYQLLYKPIISYLYAHATCSLAFSFSGTQLSWYKKKHPEFLELVSKLSSKKQIEVLGGGYYTPVFSLLYPQDRSGQIELLSSAIRQSIGRRPRGLSLHADCWDPSLIASFETCGMEYVLLDSTLIPPEKQSFIPIVVSERGKILTIIPCYHDLQPSLSLSPEAYLQIVCETVRKKNTIHDKTVDSVVPVLLPKDVAVSLLTSGWWEKLCSLLQTTYASTVQMSLPLQYMRGTTHRIPAYIPSGVNPAIAQWCIEPYTKMAVSRQFPVTVYDYLHMYPVHHVLYNRMLYVSMLVNQCHGDKMRKKAAREKLWEAQNGIAYVCTPSLVLEKSPLRNAAFEKLIEAEKLIRDSGDFHPSITTFDYNGDGLIEYICQMEQYTACIGLNGGSLFELDVMKNCGSYTTNLSRLQRYDAYDDGYLRGLFVDHLFNKEQFSRYIVGKSSGSIVFSQTQYSQSSFNSQRHDISLIAYDSCFESGQAVSLRKNYHARADGMAVQYILKNDSPIPLTVTFAVEFNFTQTTLDKQYSLEIVDAGERQFIDTYEQYPELLGDVSAVQLVDELHGISFILTPNENSGFCSNPIVFMRPDNNGAMAAVTRTYSFALFWDVQLAPGLEIEKTINLGILTLRKRNRKV
nr:DUF1926 domain-containing protein [Treponema sp.]